LITTDRRYIPAGQTVHHVYAAAFNFRGPVTQNHVSERIARQLLCAEYQATVLAAWQMSKKYPGRAGSKRLVLTALGGGVFDNPFEWIIGAVASTEELIRQSGLTVYFVCFHEAIFQSAKEAGLSELIRRLNGRIVVTPDEL
jgi:hypothetical protein